MTKYYDEVMGAGSPLVYLPGTGWSGMQGLHIAENLSNTHQSHLVDLPGIGRSRGIQGRIAFDSMADWLRDYLTWRKLGPVTLVGHSLGGAIALSFALKYPEEVKKLVLLDIGHRNIPFFPTRMFGALGYFVPFFSLVERVFGPGKDKEDYKEVLHNIPELRKQMIQQTISRGDYNLPDLRFLERALERRPQPTNSGFNLLLALYRTDLPGKLVQVSVPCALVYGTYEHQNTSIRTDIRKSIAKIASKRPDLHLIPLSSGHYPQWSDVAVAEKINNFLNA